jgi:NitT/TauT family transport system permease protein
MKILSDHISSSRGAQASAQRRRRSMTTKMSPLWPLAGFMTLILLWEIVISIFHVRPFIVPGPLTVLRAIVANRAMLWANFQPTFIEAISGFFIGNLIGILIATAFVHSQTMRKIYFPVVVLFNTIPIIAVSPILILVFGLTLKSKVAIAAFVCMFPTLVNVLRGLESPTHNELELMRIMSASKSEVFFRLRLPRSLPFLFTALKIAATSSVIGAIISEWVGAESGIGVLIIQSTFDYKTEVLYSAIAASSALALLMFWAVTMIEMIVVKWRPD